MCSVETKYNDNYDPEFSFEMLIEKHTVPEDGGEKMVGCGYDSDKKMSRSLKKSKTQASVF